jgi:cob(I)alamin adenosyltransferase
MTTGLRFTSKAKERRMGNRLSKIYTRTGDDGSTGLGDGKRISKDSDRIEVIGTVDELNSQIGVVLAFCEDQRVTDCLILVQHDLFNLGGELCLPEMTLVSDAEIERLENDLDEFNKDLPPLKEFILPGGDSAAAFCHLARTVCRRAERRLVTLSGHDTVAPPLARYLNRLSDLLFVVARRLAVRSGRGEQLWNHDRGK